MNTPLPGALARLFSRLFALALYLLPEGTRREYAAEMGDVFCARACDAARLGAWAVLALGFREARDLPLAIASAHIRALRGRMNPAFPSTSDRASWPAALLSLLPYAVAGPLTIAMSYQPGWIPREYSRLYLLLLLAGCAALAAGLAVGAMKKFPRWAYPYPISFAISLSLLLGYAMALFGGGIRLGNTFFPFLGIILIALWLPGLRAYYRNIPQDWTLLSYGLFALVLFLLSSLDYDETPRLTLLVLLPSLVSLATALAHLRIRSAFVRVAVLLVGTFAGLFLWLIPLAFGMINLWAGIIITTLMLSAFAIALEAILLAPMLVTLMMKRRRKGGTIEGNK